MHPLHLFHFCPRCGSTLFHPHDFKAYKCDQCGFIYYFNPATATVALITNSKGELLVARRAKEPAKRMLDLPGGFVDMHETAEAAIKREVLEETGLAVQSTHYLFSLPNTYLYSGFTVHTVDLFFQCEVENEMKYQPADDVEELFYVPLQELRAEMFGLNSMRQAITMLKKQAIF